MIATGYVLLRVVHVSRRDVRGGRPWRWIVDVLIVVVAGLIVGLLFGRGGGSSCSA